MSNRGQFTPAQIVRRLGEVEGLLGEGATIDEATKHVGISELTFHRWWDQYGGMREFPPWSGHLAMRSVEHEPLEPLEPIELVLGSDELDPVPSPRPVSHQAGTNR